MGNSGGNVVRDFFPTTWTRISQPVLLVVVSGVVNTLNYQRLGHLMEGSIWIGTRDGVFVREMWLSYCRPASLTSGRHRLNIDKVVP